MKSEKAEFEILEFPGKIQRYLKFWAFVNGCVSEILKWMFNSLVDILFKIFTQSFKTIVSCSDFPTRIVIWQRWCRQPSMLVGKFLLKWFPPLFQNSILKFERI